MIFNSNEARCTLMANTPLSDVELLFPCPNTSAVQLRISSTKMRIKLSQQRQLVEISRFVSSPVDKMQGEWTKKVCPFISDGSMWNPENLDNTEIDGMKMLVAFLKLCEATEAVDNATLSSVPSPPTTPTEEMKTFALPRLAQGATRTSLSSIDLLARPRKLTRSRSIPQFSASHVSHSASLTPESSFDQSLNFK
jgi:hypothetical protein